MKDTAFRGILLVCLTAPVWCQVNQSVTPENQARIAQLIEASARGDERVVRTLLAQGTRGYVDREGRSAVHEAAARGHTAVLKLLLSGADPNVRNGCGETALHLAAAAGHAEAVRLLLSAHGQPNDRVTGGDCAGRTLAPGDTPLHGAARSGHLEVLRDLIAARADVRLPNARWLTPLFLAVARNDAAAVEMLVAAGADVHMPSRTGRTPLAQAAANGNADVAARLIAQHADVDAADASGITPLMLAAKAASAPVVRLLVRSGADPLLRDGAADASTRRTALVYAVEGGDPAIAAALFDARAPAAAAQAVALAAATRKTTVLRELLARGAPADAPGECKRTPLMNAAAAGDLETVTLLLGKGANASAAEEINGPVPCVGDTPLIEAAFHNHLAVVKALLDAGATVGRRNASGWNAIDALRMNDAASAESRDLLERMRRMAKIQPVPYDAGPTPVFRSKALLWAVATLAEPHPGEAAAAAATRARIAKDARDLIARWPANTWQAYGVALSKASERPRPFVLNEYDRSLSLDLVLMDYAERGSSAELLPIVAEDIAAKLADCRATGPSGGPEERVSFVFKTMRPPKEDVFGFRLRYADRKMVGLSLVRRQPIEFVSSPNPSESTVNLQPGTYWMFVEDEASQARTLCDKVEVGKHVELARTFNVAAAAKGNECRIR
jgi:ankyrin repeat protein